MFRLFFVCVRSIFIFIVACLSSYLQAFVLLHVLFSSCGLNRGVADGLVWIISWTVLSWHAPFHLPSRGCASALRLLLWYCVARNRRCVALVVSLVTSLTIALVSFGDSSPLDL